MKNTWCERQRTNVCHDKRRLIRVKKKGCFFDLKSGHWEMDYTERRFKLFSFFNQHISPGLLCVSPCQIIAYIIICLLLHNPTFVCRTLRQIQCNLLPFPVFLLQRLYLTCPLALSLSPRSLFPPPVSGHWLLYMNCMMKCHSPT